MSEYPVQDFDQLQGLDSNNSRLDPFLDEVNDFEYLDWLSKCGGASGPASGLTLLAPSISLPSSALSHHATPFELSPGTGIDSNEAQSVNFTDHGSLVYLASLPLRAWLTMSHGYDQHTAQSYWHVPDSYSQLNGTLHHSPIDERQRVPLPIGQQMEASMAIVNTSGLSDEDEENGLGAELGGSPTKITYPCLAQCGDSECRKEYKSRGGLYRHRVPEEKRSVDCDFCGLTITRWNLARHKNTKCPALDI